MSDEFKDRLANKFDDAPLIRLLIYEPWFRAAFGLLMAGAIFMVLFLPKWWLVTPPGMLPEYRISGLDLVQAWSLKRSAIKSEAAGKVDDAIYCWQAAVHNSPADIELLHGSLRYLASLEAPKSKHLSTAIGHSLWLLRINHTNKLDSELSARAVENFRMHEMSMALLRPFLGQLTPRMEATYLKSLFNLGLQEHFAARWKNSTNLLEVDRELELYHAAWQAGWGSPEEAPVGRQKLARAMNEPKTRVLANRLQLHVSWQLLNAVEYGAALERLTEYRADSIGDNANYWRLLAMVDRKEEGRRLAEAYPHPPTFSNEALQIALACAQLGLGEYARNTLKRYAPQFGHASDLWSTFAEMLIQEKLWDDLRELAVQIRGQDSARANLLGYTYYLEGRANIGLRRREAAAENFLTAAQYPFTQGNLGLRTASALLTLGFPEPARDILIKMEEVMKLNAPYWQVLFDVAFQLKQPALLLQAATKAYELKKDDVICRNNMAAALLINRTDPDQAVKLTLELIFRYPESRVTKINHALALIHLNRNDEAKKLLDSVSLADISEIENTAYHLGLFELALNTKSHADAWRASEKIEKRHLFPNQINWFDRARQDLPPRTAATTK